MAGSTESKSRFGRYELLGCIGRGGMAEIHKARIHGPDGFEKILVLKKILPRHAASPAFVEMLVAEAKVTATLQHANIVPIVESSCLPCHRAGGSVGLELDTRDAFVRHGNAVLVALHDGTMPPGLH